MWRTLSAHWNEMRTRAAIVNARGQMERQVRIPAIGVPGLYDGDAESMHHVTSHGGRFAPRGSVSRGREYRGNVATEDRHGSTTGSGVPGSSPPPGPDMLRSQVQPWLPSMLSPSEMRAEALGTRLEPSGMTGRRRWCWSVSR